MQQDKKRNIAERDEALQKAVVTAMADSVQNLRERDEMRAFAEAMTEGCCRREVWC